MRKLQDTHKYDDIIHLPRHISEKRTPMSDKDRAAQFSPFAALTGYDDVIEEAGRLTDTQSILEESGIALINDQLRQIMANIVHSPTISVKFFRRDSRKSGGAYLKITGNVKKIDTYEGLLIFTDGQSIPIENIQEIEWIP